MGRIRIRHFVENAGGTAQCQTDIVAIEKTALGMIVAVAGQKIAPAKIVGTGNRGLLDGVRPNEIRRIFVLVLKDFFADGIDRVVTSRAFGPSGMAPGFKTIAHTLFRMMFCLNKEVGYAVLQKTIVRSTEQSGSPDVLRRRSEYVHHSLRGAQINCGVFLPIDEINEIFGEIPVFFAETLGKLVGKTGAYITHGELSMLVMLMISPIAHQMRFIGIKPIQFDAGVGIAID